ncbi:beta-lactamase-like protein [Annulohypoxylon truncatum]|uniref:beta-lactamase-like protein n=1 Tax=Annulohypoxylon truncatum TaxID=327061 RepID=UPI0020083373|nr:beta-lactamase-like protein [Annulohypoxylon truncatum]KAI1212346.1 beta-lactamase-like protein [Annulohypoxylon truncatum]
MTYRFYCNSDLTGTDQASLVTNSLDECVTLCDSLNWTENRRDVGSVWNEKEQQCPLSAELAAQAYGNRMLNFIQIVTIPTADTRGNCFLLHFDNKRYVFGNISEGTQRAFVQRSIGIQKVEDVFLTGVVNWQNAGGLLGVILTIADTLAGKVENLRANLEEKKKRGVKVHSNDAESNDAESNLNATPRLRIHGGKNMAQLLATARRFVFRKGLPLTAHEIRDDPRPAKQQSSEPDWQDVNIRVWYMPIQSAAAPSNNPRKRSLEEFIGDSDVDGQHEPLSDKEGDLKLVKTILNMMFDSGWKMDALHETTLHQVKLPAKIFVRDKNGHIQVYKGPMPEDGEEVADIPVLTREPWPGATVQSLPRTEPSNQSMCYIVKNHDRRGKFNVKAAEEYGVPKINFKNLTRGEKVEGKDGMVVTPEMVLGETVPGSGFAIINLPDSSYIDPLVYRTEWSDDNIMKGVYVIFWQLGRGVGNEPRLQEFMQKMSKVKHIVSSVDACPNRISLESVAAQAFKLRCIDPDRFHLPTYNNRLSISNTPIADISYTPSVYEGGKVGKMVQFSPYYLHQDDKVVPFPDIEKMVRESQGLNNQVLEMAVQARAKVSDPEFLAKIEKVESDIPNRDAEVITLGTGSALPSKYRNVSATLVCVPGYGNYLFDCGENTLGQLSRVFGDGLPEILRDLKCIWISHLHADHHLGTASVIRAWHEETSKSNPSAKLFIASHHNMIEWLREYADIENYGFDRLVATPVIHIKNNSMGQICQPRVFSEDETAMFGLERIDSCFVQHCFGALATVFTFPSGFKIAYSGDCRPSEDFVEIGKGATLLIHESTFEDELLGDAIAKKHSTMSEAIDVGRRMGARRILLTHFSQRYQKIPTMEENFEIRPDAKDDEKAQLDEVILVAFDYMRVKLGDFRKAQAFLPALQKLFEEVETDELEIDE